MNYDLRLPKNVRPCGRNLKSEIVILKFVSGWNLKFKI